MRCLTALIVPVLIFASQPAMAGKIGFVDAERAVVEVEEGKVKLAELQAWQEPYQVRLDNLRDQVLSLRDQLNNKRGTASAEVVSEIERNEIDAMRAFEDARREYERELETKKNEVLAAIASRIGAIGADYAKANDYDAVFLLGAQPLVYISEAANLTDEIIEIYNQRFPVSGQ